MMLASTAAAFAATKPRAGTAGAAFGLLELSEGWVNQDMGNKQRAFVTTTFHNH